MMLQRSAYWKRI